MSVRVRARACWAAAAAVSSLFAETLYGFRFMSSEFSGSLEVRARMCCVASMRSTCRSGNCAVTCVRVRTRSVVLTRVSPGLFRRFSSYCAMLLMLAGQGACACGCMNESEGLRVHAGPAA